MPMLAPNNPRLCTSTGLDPRSNIPRQALAFTHRPRHSCREPLCTARLATPTTAGLRFPSLQRCGPSRLLLYPPSPRPPTCLTRRSARERHTRTHRLGSPRHLLVQPNRRCGSFRAYPNRLPTARPNTARAEQELPEHDVPNRPRSTMRGTTESCPRPATPTTQANSSASEPVPGLPQRDEPSPLRVHAYHWRDHPTSRNFT